MFRLIRLLFMGTVLAAGVILIEPSWSSDQKTLSFRVRSGAELKRLVQRQARSLGERVVEVASEEEMPHVSQGPPAAGARSVERLSPAEQADLDRLIREKTRGR